MLTGGGVYDFMDILSTLLQQEKAKRIYIVRLTTSGAVYSSPD